jgi:hypothetical protein
MAIVTRNAPAGADYTGFEGLIVYETAPNEATVSTLPATEEPLGVITAVDPSVAPQRLTIAAAGAEAKLLAGGVIPPGTRKVKTGVGSVGFVSPTNFAGATWQHVVGVLVHPHGGTTEAGQFVDIIVQPTINLET